MARTTGRSGFKMKSSPTKGKLQDFFKGLGTRLKEGQQERGIFSEAGKAKAKEARTPKWKREADARKLQRIAEAKAAKTSWGTTDPSLNVQDPRSEISGSDIGGLNYSKTLGSDPDYRNRLWGHDLSGYYSDEGFTGKRLDDAQAIHLTSANQPKYVKPKHMGKTKSGKNVEIKVKPQPEWKQDKAKSKWLYKKNPDGSYTTKKGKSGKEINVKKGDKSYDAISGVFKKKSPTRRYKKKGTKSTMASYPSMKRIKK